MALTEAVQNYNNKQNEITAKRLEILTMLGYRESDLGLFNEIRNKLVEEHSLFGSYDERVKAFSVERIFDPENDDFGDIIPMSYDSDHRFIFNNKIRCIWLAMRNISTVGDTTEAKIKRLQQRLFTRADGAWDDFAYYRAVDFIEMYPNWDFYREMLDRSTDEMIEKAMKK